MIKGKNIKLVSEDEQLNRRVHAFMINYQRQNNGNVVTQDLLVRTFDVDRGRIKKAIKELWESGRVEQLSASQREEYYALHKPTPVATVVKNWENGDGVD